MSGYPRSLERPEAVVRVAKYLLYCPYEDCANPIVPGRCVGPGTYREYDPVAGRIVERAVPATGWTDGAWLPDELPGEVTCQSCGRTMPVSESSVGD